MGSSESVPEVKEFTKKNRDVNENVIVLISGSIVYDKKQLKTVLRDGHCLKNDEVDKIVESQSEFPVSIQYLLTTHDALYDNYTALGFANFRRVSKKYGAKYSLVIFDLTRPNVDFQIRAYMEMMGREAERIVQSHKVVVLMHEW